MYILHILLLYVKLPAPIFQIQILRVALFQVPDLIFQIQILGLALLLLHFKKVPVAHLSYICGTFELHTFAHIWATQRFSPFFPHSPDRETHEHIPPPCPSSCKTVLKQQFVFLKTETKKKKIYCFWWFCYVERFYSSFLRSKVEARMSEETCRRGEQGERQRCRPRSPRHPPRLAGNNNLLIMRWNLSVLKTIYFRKENKIWE